MTARGGEGGGGLCEAIAGVEPPDVGGRAIDLGHVHREGFCVGEIDEGGIAVGGAGGGAVAFARAFVVGDQGIVQVGDELGPGAGGE